MDPLPVFDGCQVLSRVRAGPIADLYDAVQQPLGRRVLVKALSSSILPSSPFAATLEREAHLLAELDHPNILHVYDFVRREDRMWLVLEHVDGWTLEDLLQRLERLPPPAAVAVARDLARALDHAHQRRVIHRDVQPRNVLISRRGVVKITNFAVAVDERLPTAPELLDGSTSFVGPAYMSPELILGEPPDPRSDLFSLGVVLYEMLSGKRPFDGPDERSTTQRIRHDAAAPIARVVPKVRASLERTIQHCLAKLPSDRFRSAGELEVALEAILDEYGVTSARKVLAESLSESRLDEEAPRSLAGSERSHPPLAEPPSLAPVVRMLLVCAGLIAAGGAALQYLAARNEESVGTRRASPRLELLPAQPGYLRVVADPWAYVVVDGQRVETTPFAEPIPLRAGVHYVRLEHPNAPPELRTIKLASDETVLLDVKMNVPASARAKASLGLPSVPAVDGGADAAGPSP